MYQYLLSLLVVCGFAGQAFAQLGGQNTYEFLNLSPSARISALGGNLITVRDDDVNLAYANPALANSLMHQKIAFNHSFHVAGTNHGYASYGHNVEKWKTTFHGGIQYVAYGEFNRTNELGEREGTFKAAEYAITLGGAYQAAERLALGANLKVVTSQLESYNSVGLVSDLAATYFDTASNFTASFVIRNVGTQFSAFTEGNNEPLPFEMQLGISKRLKYLPFRFSVIYRYLDRWNITYDNPNGEQGSLFLGEFESEKSDASIWVDNFFRHFVFNGEFLIGKRETIRLRAGYNHLMRKEMSVENFRSMAGFTFGVGIRIKRFRIDYGRNNFHLGGGVNHLGISTSIGEFKR